MPRRIRLASRHGPEKRGRRPPAGRLRLRRLPAGGRARPLFSGHGERHPLRHGRRAGARDLQRVPGPAGSGPLTRSGPRQPRAVLRLQGRPHAGREHVDRLHAALRTGRRRPDAGRAHGRKLPRAAGNPDGARIPGRDRLSILRRPGPGDRLGEPQRRDGRDRRHLEPRRQRRRPDAAPRPVRGRGPRQRRREADVRVGGPGARRPMISAELIADHNLSEEEYSRILEILGREPNLVELGVFSAMWSEHCSYKSSRIHLRNLPTQGPRVIQGPGENAGIVDIGDGLALAFKMESHNHPSYIEPYQGAATGVGGILRDVFTMGARPIGSLDSLRFGRLDAPRMRHLVDGVVRGIAGYGNCIGIPTVAGETTFHPGYDSTIRVNVMNVGLVEKDRIFLGRAEGGGNPVVYVGSKTGRDGIHGATMASEEFVGDETRQKRPTVQVGDPFTEKLLMEACLELFRTDAVVGIQDMGAAGLTSSAFEMAGRAGSGLEIDLSKVPVRETGMTPYEILLSESQERMLLVARRDRLDSVMEVFAKWDLAAVEIGRVTTSGRVVLFFEGSIVADLPAAPLSDRAPVYDRPRAIPAAAAVARWREEFEPSDYGDVLKRMLASANL